MSAHDKDFIDAQAFARKALGPRSEALVSDPGVREGIAKRMDSGFSPEDSVLHFVHREAGSDRELASEFLAFFAGSLQRVGHGLVEQGLRRFLETEDLAQSVLGDLWPRLAEIEFETSGQFVALLAKRISWKARDRARNAKRSKRQEDRHLATELEALAHEARAPAPGLEDRDQLAAVLMRLPERDRQLLTLRLRGESVETMMQETGLSREALKKAMTRAFQRARAFGPPAS